MIMNNLTSGIYCIRNTMNGKRYVGQSRTLSARKTGHFWRLQRGTHPSAHLQAAWNRYGGGSFVFEVLELCNPERLHEREAYWIAELKACDRQHGYNSDPTPSGGPRGEATKQAVSLGKLRSGYRHSEETKRKISQAKQGKPLGACPEARRKAISQAKAGCTFTEDHRKKLSEAKKGKPGSRTGSTHSEASKRKMADAKRGKPNPRKGTKRVNVDGHWRYLTPEPQAPSE